MRPRLPGSIRGIARLAAGGAWLGGVVLALLLAAGPARALPIFQETFSTDATQAQFAATYPSLTPSSNPGPFSTYYSFSVSGGMFQPVILQGGSTLDITGPSVSGPLRVTAVLGAPASTLNSNNAGNFDLGVRFGTQAFVFHPGYTGGTLYVSGQHNYTNIGFTAALGVLHTLLLDSDGAGHFTVTLVNGSNPNESFSAAYTNLGLAGSRTVGLVFEGNAGTGMFDSITVTATPEPGFVAIAAAGFALLALGRARRT